MDELLVPMVFGWGVILYIIYYSCSGLGLGGVKCLQLPLGCLVGM